MTPLDLGDWFAAAAGGSMLLALPVAVVAESRVRPSLEAKARASTVSSICRIVFCALATEPVNGQSDWGRHHSR